MFIEFDLKGSKARHKGVFDTTGFWVRFEPQLEDDRSEGGGKFIDGWKIFSHFSFSFYHEKEDVALDVYVALINALGGVDWEGDEIGYIREVC